MTLLTESATACPRETTRSSAGCVGSAAGARCTAAWTPGGASSVGLGRLGKAGRLYSVHGRQRERRRARFASLSVMYTVHHIRVLVLGSLLAGLLLPAVPLGAHRGDDGRSTAQTLERLRLEEREREEARAAAAAEEEAALERRQRELEQERERAAIAAREAQAAFERRRAAMGEWHRSLSATLAPLIDARERLYRRLPYRMFAAVRPACVAFAEAVEPAARGYRKAPDRLVDALVRDLFLVYRESARHCVEGAYFSFTVREGQVRTIVGELIAALAPYGLGFPFAVAGEVADGLGE
jgi:hypothetical protein